MRRSIEIEEASCRKDQITIQKNILLLEFRKQGFKIRNNTLLHSFEKNCKSRDEIDAMQTSLFLSTFIVEQKVIGLKQSR